VFLRVAPAGHGRLFTVHAKPLEPVLSLGGDNTKSTDLIIRRQFARRKLRVVLIGAQRATVAAPLPFIGPGLGFGDVGTAAPIASAVVESSSPVKAAPGAQAGPGELVALQRVVLMVLAGPGRAAAVARMFV
jgi:hypothetical protein